MAGKLLNVRLDEERLRKARRLRQHGVTLSDLVRDAIDSRFGESEGLTPRDVRAIVARIHEAHPDPAALAPRGYDVHDPHVSRAAIRRRLRRRAR